MIRYTDLLKRAKIEEEYSNQIDATPLDEHAFLAQLVTQGLRRVNNDTRTEEQTSSFERRVHVASTQRGWAALVIAMEQPGGRFSVEAIAKQVHIGWARSIVTEWDPLYGPEPIGPPMINENGAFDIRNFESPTGYVMYEQRVQMAALRYFLPGEAPSGSLMLPESQKHGYRVAAEILLYAFFSRFPERVKSTIVERHDKFIGVGMFLSAHKN